MDLKDIDITFDFRTDTREGKDPDSDSRTLREYQQLLWSKPLPNGEDMQLNIEKGFLKCHTHTHTHTHTHWLTICPVQVSQSTNIS